MFVLSLGVGVKRCGILYVPHVTEDTYLEIQRNHVIVILFEVFFFSIFYRFA